MEQTKRILNHISREGGTPTEGEKPPERKYKVGTVVPIEWKPLIMKVVRKYGYNSINEWLRDVIRDILKKEGLIGGD